MRAYSSSPPSRQDEERTWTLLYHRGPDRSKSPRMLFGMSSFNLVYWTWYTADFVPSINASAHEKYALGQIDPEMLEKLLVDPTLSYVGLGISCIIFLGSYLYSRQLVSAIWASRPRDDGEDVALAVSTLKFPLLTQPKILDRTVYDPESNAFDGVENIVFTESELRSESSVDIYQHGELSLSEDQKKNDVVVRFNGDFSRLRGHIAVKKEEAGMEDKDGLLGSLLQQKYLLEMSSGDEVMPNASDTLLHSLVIKDHGMGSVRKGRRDSKKMSETDTKVVKERKPGQSQVRKPRTVSQLEMARGTLKESTNRKKR